MNKHKQAAEALPLYASGQLAAPEREQVEAHLRVCGECRADLALWAALDRELKAASCEVAAPDGLAERALVGARLSGVLHRTLTLIRAQAPLVRRELFPASAALMVLGVFVAVLVHKAAVFHFLAPMIAAASLAMIYGREQDPAIELTLSTPVSAWKVLLARLTLVSGYNLMLAFAASAALYTVMPAGIFGSGILGWLGPLTFLSALALVLSMWTGTGTALLISYTAWMLRWVSFGGVVETAYRGFWHDTALLIALGPLLSISGLWSAERAARPRTHAEVTG
jgi:anti-sigma factor RsiW